MDQKFKNFAEYVRYAEKSFPRDGRPEALWARHLLSGWRCHCAGTMKDPAMPRGTGEADEGARRWREQASAAAAIARVNGGSCYTQAELAEAYLAFHGRDPVGRPFADGAGGA